MSETQPAPPISPQAADAAAGMLAPVRDTGLAPPSGQYLPPAFGPMADPLVADDPMRTFLLTAARAFAVNVPA